MIEGACLCGAVRLRIARRPDYANSCNCSLCRRTGAILGYFRTGEVEVAGATASFERRDIADPCIALHFCPSCGNATHWTPTAPGLPDRMGVNLRLFGAEAAAGVPLRFPDGARWTGDGPCPFRREEIVIPSGGLEAL